MTQSNAVGADRFDSATPEMHQAELDGLIKKFDNESNFRDLKGVLKWLVTITCVVLSVFHIYTAGFGLLNEISHRTVHMAFIMGLLFIVFPRRAAKAFAGECGSELGLRCFLPINRLPAGFSPRRDDPSLVGLGYLRLCSVDVHFSACRLQPWRGVTSPAGLTGH